MRYPLGFIGAGNMAEAIARGAARTGVIPAEQMIAADPSEERLQVFESFGVTSASDNLGLVNAADTVVLAVKPQMLSALGEPGQGAWWAIDPERHTFISIMAGISSAKICEAIGKPVRVVRVMPNTPLMVGKGMAGVALGEHAQPGDDELAMRLFGACGEAVRVSEKDLDAVTAVSGSGPAYVFYLAEAMQAAADELGLSEQARLLVNQTILGSAELLSQSDDTPAELRRKVTSPGGTTAAAIGHLEEQGVRETIVAALRAARDRSIELGK
ncbi:pyrroline-5-carboxylate reductase [Algisphaera agarilytica]|uniref:Pyrroline-5-carboxylate reductase n=1 Tax=Algisphaera agarilytica TaxID=1385975 RepID=A0A7X0H8P6_9BACT|nr:pyrroline-5-carboxylate reductase [Algisphaera agarilytica]MBB6431188.1 pyrroline-5-carboxylate reductase [Algisphaera agarilytica]